MTEGLILITLVLAIGAAIELYRRLQSKPDSLKQHYDWVEK